jgi:serine/threonine protein phosphatase 1
MHAKFYEALDEVRFDPKVDRVFCAGDLVDRGTDSYRCAKLVEKPWFFAIQGNHEEMAIKGAKDPHIGRYHMKHGGKWLYDLSREKRQRVVGWLSSLPYAMEVETATRLVGIVHADCVVPWGAIRMALDGSLPEHRSACKQSIMWADQRWKQKDKSVVEGIDHVYVGHIPMRDITTLGNVTYIDGGACYGEARTVNLVQLI